MEITVGNKTLKKVFERIFGIPYFDIFSIISYVIPLSYIIFFLILPVVEMLIVGFRYEGHFSLHWFKSIFTDSYYINLDPRGTFYTVTDKYILVTGVNFGVIINSLLVAISVTAITTVIGISFAYIMYRYSFPGKNVFRILLFIPLLVTPFVNAYVVSFMFNPRIGPFNYLLHDILGILPKPLWIDGLVGVVLAQSIAYYPIVYLNAYASFVNIDPSLEEQAENLGSKGFKLFRTVTLPLALPGIAAGATLVFIFSLEDLGAPIVFQASLGKYLISYEIYSAITQETGYVSPEKAALSIILLAISLTAFFLIRKYVGLKQYAMMSKGGRWYVRTFKPKWWQYLIIYAIMLPVLLFTIFPQAGVFMLAFSESWSRTPYPQGFTFAHLAEIVTNPDVKLYITNSIVYSISAVILIVIISILSSYAANRFRGVLAPVIEALTVLPLAIPGVVIAMSYFYFFSSVFPLDSSLNPISVNFNPGPLLILAYSIRRMPFTARSIYAGIQQVHVSLEESAMNLGASRWKAVTKVLVPLIAMNVIGGSLLSFVYAMSETSVSITIGALEMTKAPITAFMKELIVSAAASVHLAAAMGVFLIVIQITAIVISNIITKQRYAFIGLT